MTDLFTAYLEMYEGKVEWDNPKRPNDSGMTPREKNKAVRKRLGIEDINTNSFFDGPDEKAYERYGKLKAAHDTEKDKEVPEDKLHKPKPIAKAWGIGKKKYAIGQIRRMAGAHSGSQMGKFAVKDKSEGNEARKKRYGDYSDLKKLKETNESINNNKDGQQMTNLFTTYLEMYEERRSPEERKARAKELGDKQTINKVVDKYNEKRSDSRKEDPKKYYAKEEVITEVSDRKVRGLLKGRQKQVDRAMDAPRADTGVGQDRIRTQDLSKAVSKLQRSERAAKRKYAKEEVISYLIDEGFADTEEAAEVIATHMSEEWMQEALQPLPKDKMDRQQRRLDLKGDFQLQKGNVDQGTKKKLQANIIRNVASGSKGTIGSRMQNQMKHLELSHKMKSL